MSKLEKILISEQIVFPAVLYFEQVFIFCKLINKNVLEWFLLIMSKGETLRRCINLFSRNHPTVCF